VYLRYPVVYRHELSSLQDQYDWDCSNEMGTNRNNDKSRGSSDTSRSVESTFRPVQWHRDGKKPRRGHGGTEASRYKRYHHTQHRVLLSVARPATGPAGEGKAENVAFYADSVESWKGGMYLGILPF